MIQRDGTTRLLHKLRVEGLPITWIHKTMLVVMKHVALGDDDSGLTSLHTGWTLFGNLFPTKCLAETSFNKERN